MLAHLAEVLDDVRAAGGEHLPVRQGDKVIIPRGTLHAEGAVAERVVCGLAVPEPLSCGAFLAMREPAGR